MDAVDLANQRCKPQGLTTVAAAITTTRNLSRIDKPLNGLDSFLSLKNPRYPRSRGGSQNSRRSSDPSGRLRLPRIARHHEVSLVALLHREVQFATLIPACTNSFSTLLCVFSKISPMPKRGIGDELSSDFNQSQFCRTRQFHELPMRPTD
jgi:hypothetical protein